MAIVRFDTEKILKPKKPITAFQIPQDTFVEEVIAKISGGKTTIPVEMNIKRRLSEQALFEPVGWLSGYYIVRGVGSDNPAEAHIIHQRFVIASEQWKLLQPLFRTEVLFGQRH